MLTLNEPEISRKVQDRLNLQGGQTVDQVIPAILPSVLVNTNAFPVPVVDRANSSLLRGTSIAFSATGTVAGGAGKIFWVDGGGKATQFKRLTISSTVQVRIDIYATPTTNTPGSSVSAVRKNRAFTPPSTVQNGVSLGSAVCRRTGNVTADGTLCKTVQIPANQSTVIDLDLLFPIDANATKASLLVVNTSAAATFDWTLEAEEYFTQEDYSDL